MATVTEEIKATLPETPNPVILRPEDGHANVIQGQLLPLRLFTTDEYEKMVETRILSADERLELIEGVIVKMSPKGVKHSNAVRRGNATFSRHVGDRTVILTQDAIRLSDNSEPEPDLALLAPPLAKYDTRHPTPSDVFLILEIADSSLSFDRKDKTRLYASAGIVHYCILNLKARELEDYRDPGADGYRRKQTHTAGQSFNLVAFPKLTVDVDELLPPEANS
ncbi:MAG: Uma2 family endonuclease [Pyrinomonadaceae bacterium]|nr:Uma2 family endonuclease [Pyrinomonadaceae bacterium]